MELTLESLGMTREELQERVVGAVVGSLVRYESADEDGYICERETEFAKELQKQVKDRLDAAVAQIAEAIVIPSVAGYIEALDFRSTNAWGESKDEKITFREYLAGRAESYLTEKVDYNGRSQQEARAGSYGGWSGTQTRICHLVHQHLHHEIERIMGGAVKSANEAITEGIAETVKIKLKEIANSLKVSVSTK